MSERIQFHWQLEVYQLSVEAGMAVFHASQSFPPEEKFSLTNQIRRSSRSVSGQIAEGWRKRKYEAAFVNKLNDAEGEVQAACHSAFVDAGRAIDLVAGLVHAVRDAKNGWTADNRMRFARAIAVRCFCPPERSLNLFFAFSLRFTVSSSVMASTFRLYSPANSSMICFRLRLG